MIYTKYKFTPYDVAAYIFKADLRHSRIQEVYSDLFNNHNSDIVYTYRNDFMLFKSKTNEFIYRLELDDDTLNEAELIIKEVNSISKKAKEYEPDYFGAYFKLIKLQLMYSDIDYRKIKLRTLLKDFGFKRRSYSRVANINKTIKALGLVPYVKKRTLCRIDEVKIDDMIIIRLN